MLSCTRRVCKDGSKKSYNILTTFNFVRMFLSAILDKLLDKKLFLSVTGL